MTTSGNPSSMISYNKILKNELKSHKEFDEWRAGLFEYLRQEGLKHVVAHRPSFPLGFYPDDAERARWIERMLAEAKVKSILLHTIPLGNFREDRDCSAYDILAEIASQCAVSAAREEGEN